MQARGPVRGLTVSSAHARPDLALVAARHLRDQMGIGNLCPRHAGHVELAFPHGKTRGGNIGNACRVKDWQPNRPFARSQDTELLKRLFRGQCRCDGGRAFTLVRQDPIEIPARAKTTEMLIFFLCVQMRPRSWKAEARPAGRCKAAARVCGPRLGIAWRAPGEVARY
jgi:hypothetical protein